MQHSTGSDLPASDDFQAGRAWASGAPVRPTPIMASQNCKKNASCGPNLVLENENNVVQASFGLATRRSVQAGYGPGERGSDWARASEFSLCSAITQYDCSVLVMTLFKCAVPLRAGQITRCLAQKREAGDKNELTTTVLCMYSQREVGSHLCGTCEVTQQKSSTTVLSLLSFKHCFQKQKAHYVRVLCPYSYQM